MLVHVVLLIATAVWYIVFPYETHHWGEWDVFSMSILLSNGQSPYFLGDLTYATSVPYQFLYPLLCALPVKIFGPHLWIGRSVSLLSYGMILLLSVLILRRKFHVSPIVTAASCMMIILVQPITGYSLLKAHPNALCIATGLLALYLSPAANVSLRAWLPALAAGVLCFFVKQTGILFLIALFPSILIRHRWKGLGLVLTVVVSIVLVAIALNTATNGSYGFFCFSLPSSYPLILNRIDDGIRFMAAQAFIFIAAAIPLFLRRTVLRDPVLTAGLLSLPISLYAYSVWGGTETNFAFCLILLSLVSARYFRVLGRVLNKSDRVLLMSGVILVAAQLVVPFFQLQIPGKQEHEAARRTAAIIGQPGKSVLALDAQQYAFLAGKPQYTNVEAMKQFMHMGISSFPVIERMIEEKSFDIVAVHALRFSSYDEQELKVLRLLKKNYHIAETINSSSVYSPLYILHPDTGSSKRPKIP